MQPIVKNCAGIDVHKMMVMVSIRKAMPDGSVQVTTHEFGTFRKDREAMCQFLQQHQIDLAVMESTGVYWKSIYASIIGRDLNPRVVNARHVKNVPGRKTDTLDSQWLAQLAHCGLVRPSFVPHPDQEQLRLLTRRRDALVKQTANEKNRLHKTLDDSGIRLGGLISDINGKSGQRMVNALIDGESLQDIIKKADGRLKADKKQLMASMDEKLSTSHLIVLRDIRSHIDFLGEQLQKLEVQILRVIQPWKEAWQLLQTLPGVHEMSAATLIAEIGDDMSQFGGMKEIASWAGLCPGNNESAGKRKSGRTRKGNKMIKTTLCEVANAAIRTKSQFKGKYQGLVIRRGHKRSLIAIAHKLIRVIYTLLKKRQPYVDPDTDYEGLTVRKNASRWLRKLEEYGYLAQVQQQA
ncbi:IS110 family RNA-guided transposase [Endozoicomonas euniceicola]|uniref:IS110 family transposase n=1 Tax=Endozoicomonas euniceicola TaxID=1234143 RepID=A0ABY6GTX2_9GAMM|nr:IS110 family transposase [Endozoicomonas euniceicola]UYM15493.1 IS110 family transposase [Endozoicomonas euniceicola]